VLRLSELGRMISGSTRDMAEIIQSQKTKGAAEKAFLKASPEATIIRPSIIFGPGDSFFTVSPRCTTNVMHADFENSVSQL
jgi:nucleoside-diphosphate-sugar epimerase